MDYETILRKITASGDLEVWVVGQPGVGLDWSWVDLTQEEAEQLADLVKETKDADTDV
jgi:hypothetical protein